MVALPACQIIVRVLLTHYRRPGPLLYGEFEFGHEFPKVDHIQFAHLSLPVERLASPRMIAPEGLPAEPERRAGTVGGFLLHLA